MIYNANRQQWSVLIMGQSIITAKLMDCDSLTIAVHVLTLSAGLPDYCTSGGEAVCNRGRAQDFFFAQSRLITRKKKKKKPKGLNLCEHMVEFFPPWLQPQLLGRSILANLPNSKLPCHYDQHELENCLWCPIPDCKGENISLLICYVI